MKKILLIPIFYCAIIYATKAQVNVQDSMALVALYNSTDGANWRTKWRLNRPVTTWHGITVESGRVTRVHIWGNQLSGTIPVDLDDLTELRRLDLCINSLRGAVPPELGRLSNLDTFSLCNNELTDLPDFSSFPDFTPRLFEIGYNHLDFGDILPNIAKLHGYSPQAIVRDGMRYDRSTVLNNDLALSVSVGGTGNTYQWFKDKNMINRATTDAMLMLSNIQETDFGFYHCEITNTAAPELTLTSGIDIVGTKIVGGVAEQDYLALEALYNSTDGADWRVPWDLSQPVKDWDGVTIEDYRVTELDINNNNLSGTLPTELGNLSDLKVLFLSANQEKLTGNIPSSLGDLSKLNSLNLTHNKLSGNIPTSLGNLKNLESLILYDNELTGAIPSSIGNLSKLVGLRLYMNQLTTIPDELGNLKKLQVLDLSNNKFTTIPSSIVNLSELIELGLQDNQFTMLTDLSTISPLRFLFVQNNHLDFGDLQANREKLTKYAPQAPVREGVRYEESTILNQELKLLVEVEGTGNVYQWFKDGNEISGATSDELILTDIKMSDFGLYHCEITNPDLPDLTLSSLPDTLNLVNQPNAIEEFDISDQINIYPNPTDSDIILEISNNIVGDIKLSIYILDGKKIFTLADFRKTQVKQIYKLDLEKLPAGIYILNVAVDRYFANKQILKN